MIGIYKITSPSNKIYIGQSIDIKKRFDSYRRMDKKNKKQTKLWNSFLKHGFLNHKFEIIEECSIELLNERERYYQDLHNVLSINGLNCLLTKTNTKKQLSSKESIEKQRLKMIGKQCNLGNKHSKETKEKISLIHKGNKYNLGRKQPKEQIENRVSKNKKLILDLNSGIFYDSPIEYAKLNNINYNTLTCRLMGRLKNNTNLIYV
jgi:group I intron endonuclease